MAEELSGRKTDKEESVKIHIKRGLNGYRRPYLRNGMITFSKPMPKGWEQVFYQLTLAFMTKTKS